MPVIQVYVNNEMFGKFVGKTSEEQKEIRDKMVKVVEKEIK